MSQNATKSVPQAIAATGHYETVATSSAIESWVYDPDGNPFVLTDSKTAKHIAKTLNTVELGCSCGGSCGNNCKCK